MHPSVLATYNITKKSRFRRISVHATSPVLGSQSIAREVVVVVDKTFTLCDVWRSYFDDIVATFSLDVRRRVTGFSGTYEWVEKTSARTSISPLEKVQDGKSYIYNAVQVSDFVLQTIIILKRLIPGK